MTLSILGPTYLKEDHHIVNSYYFRTETSTQLLNISYHHNIFILNTIMSSSAMIINRPEVHR